MPFKEAWTATFLQLAILAAVAYSGHRLVLSAVSVLALLFLLYVTNPASDITFSAIAGYVITGSSQMRV
ncbi:hypothetical protein [Propionibacterium cyclohexanicum]|uniref:hypothetical protein n=1 Tax=Propionibacterium cyclohexanicum TaxID=64702 RepID=UPI000B85CF97|nr:hypothetical protein [Propionibacterium cyclohexanicum]